MYEKVLFPTDFSEYAKKTLQCIEDIPGIKEVVLLHVVDATKPSKHGWIFEPQIEDAKIILEEQKGHIENIGLKATTKLDVIRSGSVPNTILETADKDDVDLIVLNARGKGLVRSLLLGSVPLEVIRNSKRDILLMRQKLAEDLEGKKFEKFCPRILSKVLYPTDFSKLSENRLSFVKNLSIQEIVLVHVVTKGETAEEIENNIQDAKKQLEDINKKFKDAGFKTKEHVRVGHPSDEICSLAEEEDVSLIAMSSHGKSWVEELLIGDTTFDVAKRAKTPVLILKPK